MVEELTKANVLDSGEGEKRREQLIEQLASRRNMRQRECVGLRVDLRIVDSESHPKQEMIVDVTSIHPTCKTRIKAEWKKTLENMAEGEKQEALPIRKRRHLVGAAVDHQTKLKHEKYAPLMALLKKQQLDGKRDTHPIFIAGVCSTLGEFGPDLFQLQEWLTKVYARKLEREEDYKGPRLDGLSTATLTAEFRTGFKTSLQVAVAKGLARMLSEAGLAFSNS